MPIQMPNDTAQLFARNAEEFDSRSLLLDKFVYDLPQPKMEEARRLHFARVCSDSFAAIQASRVKWQKKLDETRKENERHILQTFLDDTAAMGKRTAVIGPAEAKKVIQRRQKFLEQVVSGKSLYAQLQSRLMVNMASGVMENAGLCIDRFGLPYVPGSAVKGCARRAALAALREWCEAGVRPEHKPADLDNSLAACCEKFATPAEMLTAIARVFGWCDLDWSNKRKHGRCISDFAWACSPTGHDTPTQANALDDRFHSELSPESTAQARTALWLTIRDAVSRLLAAHLRIPLKADDPKPWQKLPNFAGGASFLPAYLADIPAGTEINGMKMPQPGKLELDVVTVHHKKYYAGPEDAKNLQSVAQWEHEWGTAPDIEEPIPIIFPAVAPGHVFAFNLVPMHGPDEELLKCARIWLATGLETFGLGAKTNAGYGWFDCSGTIQNVVSAVMKEREEKRRAEEAAAEKARAESEIKAEAEKAEQKRLSRAPAYEQFRTQYARLDDQSFADQAKKYAEMSEDQRRGFVMALHERRDTAKRWSRRKPELMKPWQEFSQGLQPPIQLP